MRSLFRRGLIDYRCLAAACTLWWLIITSPAFAGVIYVANGGSDSNTGDSWNNAKATITGGIAAAAMGDQVWVKNGSYAESFTIRSGVGLYGGFTGGEAVLSQRPAFPRSADDPYETYVNGTGASRQVTVPAEAVSDTIIDGFTLAYGSTGVHCYGNSNPKIRNNRIMYHSSAVYCYIGANAEITNNRFSANSGRAVFMYYSSASVRGNVIINSGTSGLGGGSGSDSMIYAIGASPVIAGNNIRGNYCRFGAIWLKDSGGVICNNSIAGNGGPGIRLSNSSTAVVNNTMISNTYGIYLDSGASPAIYNNIMAYGTIGLHNNSTGTVIKRNNCLYNPSGSDYSPASWGVGDVLADPQLPGLAFGNSHISATSPCRDAGYDAGVAAGYADIDGQVRIEGTRVDIGADESYGETYPSSPPTVIRVSSTGNDLDSGSSWAIAKRTISSAIEYAAETGGDVWVKAGEYVESVRVPAYVHLYGGFAGTEATREERNWCLNTTAISASVGRAVTISVGQQTCVVDGFTITGGSDSSYGAGITVDAASAMIRNNIIRGNTGRGIYCSLNTSIINNVITGNTGVGIHVVMYYSPIINNTITKNLMGIYCESSRPVVTNNIIAFNTQYGIRSTISVDTSSYNCVYNPGGQNFGSYVSPGMGDIQVNPAFIGGEIDWHPSETSPCINAGSNAACTNALDLLHATRIAYGTVDMGAVEFVPQPSLPSRLKTAPEGAVVLASDGAVSAAFDGEFYLQDGFSGIRIVKPGHGLCNGYKASIVGRLGTDTNKELYIAAWSVERVGTDAAEVQPLFMPNGVVGGAALLDPISGAGQNGVVDGTGLNNIGTLVRVCGRVLATGIDHILIDDGSKATGLRIKMDHLPANPSLPPIQAGDWLIATGISSCELQEGQTNPTPLVKLRSAGELWMEESATSDALVRENQ